MGFRLVPKSVTLNDLDWRNSRVVCVISPNSLLVTRVEIREHNGDISRIINIHRSGLRG